MLRAMLLAIAISQAAIAQLEVDVIKTSIVVGAINPRLVSNHLLVDAASNLSSQPAALIDVRHQAKFPRVKVRRSLFDLVPIERLSDSQWLVIGAGRYLVEVTTFDPELGLDERSFELLIGESPSPPIPDPLPDPPAPIPPPIPDVIVPNDYNVGMIALKTAPHDAPGAKSIAAIYRSGANKLFGIGGLSDIDSIRKEIGKQLDLRPCPDRIICDQWKVWRDATNKASIAEQIKRGTFTKQDWYLMLIEISTALEAVR